MKKILFLFFALTVVVSIAIFTVALLPEMGDYQARHLIRSIPTIAYVVIAGGFGFVTLLVAYQVIRWVVRLVARWPNLFGETPQARIISLGMASVVFSSVIPELFRVLISFFTEVLFGLSKVLSSGPPDVSDPKVENLGSMIGQLFIKTLSSYIQIFQRALENFQYVPIAKVVLLLALAAVLGIFLRTDESQQTAGQPRLWLFRYFSSLSQAARKNCAFVLTLAVASYLSFASLAAIPALEEPPTPPAEVSKEHLQNLLEKYKGESDRLLTSKGPNRAAFEEFKRWLDATKRPSASHTEAPTETSAESGTPTSVPGAETSAESETPTSVPGAETSAKSGTPTPVPDAETSAKSVAPTRVPAVRTPPKDSSFQSASGAGASGGNETGAKEESVTLNEYVQSELRDLLGVLSVNRQQALQAYDSALVDLRQGRESLLNTALTTYETQNVGRKGSRESVGYFQNTADWYQQHVASLQQRVNDITNIIQRDDNTSTSTLRTLQESLTRASRASLSIPPLPFSSISFLYNQYRIPSADLSEGGALPVRPKLGSYLGPFSFLASWLLGAESLPLALIVGLVGFGLLGSACSTFIRQRDPTRTDGAIVSDLTSVVIPGLSAAIVVFLVVEGGLAIFASGAGQPNPYILFLICLVASVFSESVWQWAQEWLQERLSGIANGGGEEKLEKKEPEASAQNTKPGSGIANAGGEEKLEKKEPEASAQNTKPGSGIANAGGEEKLEKKEPEASAQNTKPGSGIANAGGEEKLEKKEPEASAQNTKPGCGKT